VNSLAPAASPQVAAGARHTLLRCASGTVWATGWNRYGQCCCCFKPAWRPGSGGAAAEGQRAPEAPGTEGLAQAWRCSHGEAVYRPLRVPLPEGTHRAQHAWAGPWHTLLAVVAPSDKV
jgi:hypothetical protein